MACGNLVRYFIFYQLQLTGFASTFASTFILTFSIDLINAAISSI